MKNKFPLTSVIIPGFNEEKNIESVIVDVLKLKKKYPIEIIVVDDGSKDKTSIVAKKAGADVVISYKKNKGKGGAFRVGIDKAKGDYIVQIDADHQFQPNEIPKFIDTLHKGYDVVCGTRFKKGKIEKGSVSTVNLFGNWLMSVVTTFFSGIKVTDIMAGFKGFTNSAAKKLDLSTPHFGYEAEVVVKAGKLDLKVKELPITYTKRIYGTSGVKAIRDGIKVSYTIAKMYLIFPGPPLGKGVVGKKILKVVTPMWLVGVLPLFTYYALRTFSPLFFTHLIASLLLFFLTKKLTHSRLASLIASGFLASHSPHFTPFFTSLQIMYSNTTSPLFISFVFSLFLTFFTYLLLQNKKTDFLKRTLSSILVVSIVLFFLYDVLLLTLPLTVHISIFVISIFVGRYFWKIEHHLARALVLSSSILLIAFFFHIPYLYLIGFAVMLGSYTSLLFLENVSFRNISTPLFALSRLTKALLLVLFVSFSFIVTILK